MAGALVSFVVKGIGEIVKDLLKPFAAEPIKTALASITGIPLKSPSDDNLAKVQTALRDVSNKLASISSGISTLAASIDQRFFGEKEDKLFDSTNFFDTAWDNYFETLAKYNNPPATKTVADIRSELIDTLKSVATLGRGHLNAIHHDLVVGGDNSLIAQACINLRRSSKDIITFYVTMKDYLHGIQLVQLKALILFHLADLDPDVPIVNAADIISQISPRLEAQEAFLRQRFGPGTYDLTTRILSNGTQTQEVTLAWNGTDPLRIWRAHQYATNDHASFVSVDASNSLNVRWKLTPVDGNFTVVNNTVDYRFRLDYTDGGYSLGWFFGNKYGSSDLIRRDGCGPANNNEANTFVLKPAENDFVHLLYRNRNGGKDGITFLYRDLDVKSSYDNVKYRNEGDKDTSGWDWALRLA